MGFAVKKHMQQQVKRLFPNLKKLYRKKFNPIHVPCRIRRRARHSSEIKTQYNDLYPPELPH